MLKVNPQNVDRMGAVSNLYVTTTLVDISSATPSIRRRMLSDVDIDVEL